MKLTSPTLNFLLRSLVVVVVVVAVWWMVMPMLEIAIAYKGVVTKYV